MIDSSSYLFISCFVVTFMLNAVTHTLMRMIPTLLVDMNYVSGSLGQRKIIRNKNEYFKYMDRYSKMHMNEI